MAVIVISVARFGSTAALNADYLQFASLRVASSGRAQISLL
jgi:hypothetical protein